MFRTNNYTALQVDRKTGELTEKPKRVWSLPIILLVELIGTFAMVFEIIAPSALNLEQFIWYQNIFGTFIMKAFWVSGFILILIFLLRWCSVNLNPAVTLAEVAAGHTTRQQALWMIVIQFVGAFVAAYAAFWMGSNMDVFNSTTDATLQYIDGTYTLDAVFPRLILSPTELVWFDGASWLVDGGVFVNAPIDGSGVGTFELWDATWGVNSTALLYLGIIVIIEVAFTWLLLWSVVGAKKVSHNARPFLIFMVLMVVVSLGIHTNNIALNPARLIAPSVVAQVTGGAQTMQYLVFYLAGEAIAVLLIARSFGKKEMKEAKAIYKETGIVPYKGLHTTGGVAVVGGDQALVEFKSEVRDLVLHIQEDLEITKARYEWVLKGNEPIETMTLEEVQEAIREVKAQGVIDLEQPVTILRKEFAKYIGFGADKYKQMLIAEVKIKKAAEEEAKKAEAEAAKKEAEDKKSAKKDKADDKVEDKQEEVKEEAEKADEVVVKKAPTKKAPTKKAPTKAAPTKKAPTKK